MPAATAVASVPVVMAFDAGAASSSVKSTKVAVVVCEGTTPANEPAPLIVIVDVSATVSLIFKRYRPNPEGEVDEVRVIPVVPATALLQLSTEMVAEPVAVMVRPSLVPNVVALPEASFSEIRTKDPNSSESAALPVTPEVAAYWVIDAVDGVAPA